MPDSDFFARFGWFFEKNFLDTRECARVLSGAAGSRRFPAGVVKGRPGHIDERQRRTQKLCLENDVQSWLNQHVKRIQPTLERHYGEKLQDCEAAQLLCYEKGDFYAKHRDNHDAGRVPSIIARRKFSLVLFLSRPEDYLGGELIFHGLFQDPRAKRFGLPLKGEAGLLAVFPSRVAHEVRPVTRGTRWTLVSWFF